MSFFRRLAKDPTANTLAISAASLVPVMAMVGGGVDVSRFYMAQTRLQAACDAGALAARRAMDNEEFNDTHKKVGEDFFDTNYQSGLFGLTELERDFIASDTGEIEGTASGTMPTSIMAAFGYDEFEIEVGCEADINIADTDIMLVLDVTGSMAWRPDGTDCGSSAGRWIECTDSRISALRSSVLNFYDTVEGAGSSQAQIRYGIVPYSMQVNVGKLLKPEWLKSTHEYESRETIRTLDYSSPVELSVDVVRTGGAVSGSFVDTGDDESFDQVLPTYSACVDVAFNNPPGKDDYIEHDIDDFTLVSQSDGNPRVSVYQGPARFKSLQLSGGTWYGSTSNTNRRCELDWNIMSYEAPATVTITEEIPYTWEFRYGEVSWPISSVYTNDQVSLPTGNDMANVIHPWDGCVEMPRTANTGTFDPMPSNAFDLNIDLVPSTEEQKWGPVLRTATFQRKNGSGNNVEADVNTKSNFANPYTSCPKQARKLAEFSARSELDDYLKASNGFIADGSTYLDVGMIWGAKLLTPNGIFASENAAAPDGSTISRHLVFMTDGEASPNVTSASAYGAEFWARKITTDGNYDTALARHEARLQVVCRAVRNKNITLWVVAFGETFQDALGNPVVPANLRNCATPGRSYVAANEAQLNVAFQDIAEKIADLRLTK
ncbi:hypothetical protein EH31_02065 [Erythrobacter longus]|uniref:Putative Flp pilus-assembly TadG-like N-terminal domain-containing protein n=1 Tax=Erythrobacter longus TaxID=1044 RepID=A0A074MFA0_ERYLO|nr:Tad domain-containing protein [Erythrobacter longus]KEO91475.1 hypothetical protein EH31_02065 [Erythrobacter longus]